MLRPFLKIETQSKPIAWQFLKHWTREALCNLFAFRFEKNRLFTTDENSVYVSKQWI